MFTARLVGSLAACTAVVACSPRHAPPGLQSPGATLLGRWEYMAPARAPAGAPTLGAGILVTLEFDSATGRVAYGRVTRWLSGDVTISPDAFGPVKGTVADGEIELLIPLTRPGASPITVLTSRTAADTLAIRQAQRGNESGPFASGPGALFVRTRRAATAKP